MIGLNTNILVKYLTQDDKLRSKSAEGLIEKYFGKPKSLFINNIVLCELITFLEKDYNYSKDKIASTMRQIFATEEFAFENQKLLWLALEDYEKLDLSFSHALIPHINKDFCFEKTWTFDESRSDTEDSELLKEMVMSLTD
jgi:predicted nucleic-acid-binding protein